MEVKERIHAFLAHIGINQSAFEKKAGLANGYVNNIRQSIGPSALEKITTTFPMLNKIWLLHGHGDMLLSDDAPATFPIPFPEYVRKMRLDDNFVTKSEFDMVVSELKDEIKLLKKIILK